MINKVKKLIVKYNNRVVGTLAELEDLSIAFQYDEDWIKKGFSISPFSLPLSNKIYKNQNGFFNGLYGVFQDSLPDGWGELLFNRIMAKQGINGKNLSSLTRLSLISSNGLGALTYEPCQITESNDKNFNLDEISKDIKKILSDENENADLDKVYNLGGSSGGARPKAHIKIDNDNWIVKFPCNYDPKNIGELEYNANIFAKKCDIDVNEFKLFPSRLCGGYFGAKRFDKENGKRIHMISLSSILETSFRIPNLDYLHLFQVIQNICVNKNDLYEAYKRMCFNVFYENKDDHGKNFSFLYDEKLGGYKLSPFYDISKTSKQVEHEMTVNGVGNPSEKDLLEVAKIMKLSINECKKIILKIKTVLQIK